MEHFKKKPPNDFFAMERQIGRIMRNMSFLRVPPLEKERWFPAADVYESDKELIVCVDVSGVDPQKISVIAEQSTLTISGDRRVAFQEDIKNIHQLEIERGFFKRMISLPTHIDVSATSSFCKDGFLIVRLPKQERKGKIEVKIS
jgi:HSP20 family protein